MIRARVVGTGHHLPEKVVTNHDLERIMDTTDEWIVKRTGIHERRVVENGAGTSDLGAPAARHALDAAGVDVGDVDLIVCCTTFADYVFPSTACGIQNALGAFNAAAYDVNAACSGFLYGLASADAFIRIGLYRTVLVVGAEVASTRINWKQRETAVLFGDGAGAVVLRADNGDCGILSTYLGADGRDKDLLWLPAGGSKMPITPENVGKPECDIQMKGQELFKRAVVRFVEAARRPLTDAGLTIDDIDLFVPHQANVRIINAVAERLELPPKKVFINIDKVANTTAASIPIGLDQAVREGRIGEGSLVLIGSFGAGLTWGAALIRL